MHQQRMAVGRGLCDDIGPDAAAGAPAILDHHRLAQRFLHALGNDARGDVGRAAGGKRHHDAQRLRRERLRRGKRRQQGREQQQDAAHSGNHEPRYS